MNESFSTRTLSEDEKGMAAALWKYCFADEDNFIQWYFRRKAGDILATLTSSGSDSGGRSSSSGSGSDGSSSNGSGSGSSSSASSVGSGGSSSGGSSSGGSGSSPSFGGSSDLVAQIVCSPLPLAMRGRARDAAMLAGIATTPSYRRQGHITSLMREAFRFLRDKGVCAAALYPFDYTYYERYGFARCGDIANVSVALSRLPATKPQGKVDILKGDRADAALFASVYETCYARYSGHSLRDAPAFTLLLEENALEDGFAAVYYRNNIPEGYLLYTLSAKAIRVSEIGASSQAAREDLLGFLGSHSSSVDRVEFVCPLDDPLWRLLPDPRGAVSAEPHDMLRIIDVIGAMQGLPAGQGDISIRVTDPYADWNEGMWRFYALDGKLAAEKAGQPGNAGQSSATQHDQTQYAPTLTIGALTQWAFGYLDGSGLADAGAGLSVQDALRMDALLPKKPFFIYEKY